jgi:hypothetical protein
MAALLRLPKARVAVVAIAGTLSIGAYFVGYSIMDHSRTAILMAHPFYAVWFAWVFLGTPVSYASARLGGAVGLSGLLLVALALTVAIRRRRLGDPALAVTAGVSLCRRQRADDRLRPHGTKHFRRSFGRARSGRGSTAAAGL